MNGTMKFALISVVAVFAADKIAGTFTDANDSETEKLLWKIASAAVVGVAVSKLV